MLSQEDLRQIESKGITEKQIETQLEEFKTGFPFLKLEAAAAIGKGIIAPGEDELKAYVKAWEDYKASGKDIVKFVPASGAASRMFKDMFAFLSADYDVPTTAFEKTYFDNIRKFAFYDALDKKCMETHGKGVAQLIEEGCYKAVVAAMLEGRPANSDGGTSRRGRTLRRQQR